MKIIKKGKVHLDQAMKAQKRVLVSLYSFFDLGTRWGCVDKATSRPFYPRETNTVTLSQEAGWAPGPVWTGEENHASTGI
jgi:hypothetical protein